MTAVTAAVVTGFAFNVPDDVIGLSGFTASGALDDQAWVELFPPPANDPGNAPGGYDFEGGAGTGDNIAGGTPNQGFGIGTTATFNFTFTGTLGGLTVGDFLGETVAGAGGPADFGVRFQAIPVGAGSDFAVHVPAPGAAVLLSLALPLALRSRDQRRGRFHSLTRREQLSCSRLVREWNRPLRWSPSTRSGDT